MKKLKLLSFLILLSSDLYAQTNDISVTGFYGIKAFTSGIPIKGSFEGLEIGYRIHYSNFSSYSPNYWDMKIWNADHTRLSIGKDTLTRGSFGAEYGISTGFGINLLNKGIKVFVVPQLGAVFDSRNQDNSYYANKIISNSINPVFRGELRINYKIVELTGGFSHQFNLVGSHSLNKFWIGLGVIQW